jgi:hypothetical protein
MPDSQEFVDLSNQVSASDNVIDSAKLLIDGFAARLAAAGTDPAKLSALRNDLKTHSDALAASVAANTVAAP